MPAASEGTAELPKGGGGTAARPLVVLFANTEWYLYNFRRSLARALVDAGFRVLLLSPPGPYGERLRALGLDWQPVAMKRRSLNPAREVVLLWRLVRCFRRLRPAVVHGFTIKCAIYGSLAARIAGVRGRIGAVAGMGYVFTSQSRKARLLRAPVRWLMRGALGGRGSRLIVQNPDDQQAFEQYRLFPQERIRQIAGSGVDTRHFRPVESPRDRRREWTVLLAARLLWDKGIDEYVQAARRLRSYRPAVRFLLAGAPDPGNPACVDRAEVECWHREGAIEWLGQVDDMAGLLRRVDVVVLPSYREGLPRSLIEAAACGLPLIATDVPGCRAVVAHEQTGLLVPARDAEALVAAIARMRDDPDRAAEYGRAARARAVAAFDEQIIIRQTLAVYRELMGLPDSQEED